MGMSSVLQFRDCAPLTLISFSDSKKGTSNISLITHFSVTYTKFGLTLNFENSNLISVTLIVQVKFIVTYYNIPWIFLVDLLLFVGLRNIAIELHDLRHGSSIEVIGIIRNNSLHD